MPPPRRIFIGRVCAARCGCAERSAQVSAAEADAYFATRPKDSQIGAWASAQSRPMEGRWAFEKEIAKYAAKYALSKVPRPGYWSGFRLRPFEIEFWRDKPFRLHDRLVYRREGEGPWRTERSFPVNGIAQSGRLMRRAALASVSVSLFLVAIKTFAYFASHSVALLASLADSALDLFTSALNLFAIREALAPPDREHRFGHGKAEPLAGLIQGAFIAASALFLVIQAVQRLISPQPVEHGLAALVVMLISIAMTVGLILYEREVIRRTGSLAVSADQSHYMGDLATNVGVVIAILLATGLGWLRCRSRHRACWWPPSWWPAPGRSSARASTS